MNGGQRLGAGRPKGEDARDQVIQFRLSKAEKERLEETAKHYGVSVSDLIRTALGL